MRIRLDRFPGGRNKAITLSFDDGTVTDRRFVAKLNEYGLKGTFHLNSGFFGRAGYIEANEVATLYKGHEVSVHTFNHPFLEQSPPDQIAQTILTDRKELEALTGYPVRGMSYPFGTYNDRVIAMLPSLGIEYARTVASHGRFDMPDDLYRWHPTCKHLQMVETAETFIAYQPLFSKMALLYVWGHTAEFERDQNWELIDRFGELVGGRNDIWYATNAEIVAYMQALERLRFSSDCHLVHNPSAIPVWVSCEVDPVEIPAGHVVMLK
jgi:peptidoglycan/xylan/chitin deacetylase (PgdA/CDA1 family)